MPDPPSPSRWRMLWLLPPLGIGIGIMVTMATGKPPPTVADDIEAARAVRTIEARRLTLLPVAEGYGSVTPARVWSAVAQVAGRVVFVHPRLRNGEVIPAGEELLRIDPVDYQLRVAQDRAALAELRTRKGNTEASLAIEERSLALAEREFARIRELVAQGTTSRSSADAAERTVLGARLTVQNLRNTLALIPSQRKNLEATLARAERDLEHTRISAPFNLRVSALAIEADQYTAAGQQLFRGDSVDRVEVVAQVAMGALRKLLIGRPNSIGNVAELNRRIKEVTGFSAQLSLDLGDVVATWDARFVRLSDNVDNKTRTIGVVVAVDDPLSKIRVGERPPLSKGMFVQVRLRGQPQPDRMLMPRHAIRDGRVYLVDADRRLQTRPVKVLFNQGELSVIASGIEAGQSVVISDLIPAVDGMLLDPRPDAEAQQALADAARGTR